MESERRKLWESKCKRSEGWKATRYHRICSRHFVDWVLGLGPSSSNPDPELFENNDWGGKCGPSTSSNAWKNKNKSNPGSSNAWKNKNKSHPGSSNAWKNKNESDDRGQADIITPQEPFMSDVSENGGGISLHSRIQQSSFIEGKPALLYDIKNPDWAPTLALNPDQNDEDDYQLWSADTTSSWNGDVKQQVLDVERDVVGYQPQDLERLMEMIQDLAEITWQQLTLDALEIEEEGGKMFWFGRHLEKEEKDSEDDLYDRHLEEIKDSEDNLYDRNIKEDYYYYYDDNDVVTIDEQKIEVEEEMMMMMPEMRNIKLENEEVIDKENEAAIKQQQHAWEGELSIADQIIYEEVYLTETQDGYREEKRGETQDGYREEKRGETQDGYREEKRGETQVLDAERGTCGTAEVVDINNTTNTQESNSSNPERDNNTNTERHSTQESNNTYTERHKTNTQEANITNTERHSTQKSNSTNIEDHSTQEHNTNTQKSNSTNTQKSNNTNTQESSKRNTSTALIKAYTT
ncbi:hypothetical protein Pcinc_025201 [Petrolisthes cinctipes]|uniref:Uncharacterized protein n=1 Tax=Petrolisthes cinctipes TaxID=88211 RepID=A0AAE1F988_PETCI|nr:hypothetical protein Pcinc_025201 [Petrolisthes cinctipes]